MAHNQLARGPQMSRSAWDVDPEWIAEEKLKPTDVPFVSTNDVVTSWCFRSSDFAWFGTMLVNMRNRIPSLTDAHIGNYESAILFQKGEYEQPAHIRRTLLDPKRLGTDHDNLPSASILHSGRWHCVSSWVMFYRDVRLPGCQLKLHMPIPFGEMPLPELSIVFGNGKGGVGVMLWEHGGQSTRVPRGWKRIGRWP
eukprot:gnl/TRDRNA2_/TRDRNA2_144234_c0_seq1.p1 gnl/TRDRNA2_/TRDRNA2_144234_c0~~gnl/TRDRNA2_/TRDRNA2_144234_c0_seq1.p1  ORF type:complete len:228 (+),score=19.10 gnl/TRDRNA2_/TRDRNA2_144234_c0_seq1:97-684(+)